MQALRMSGKWRWATGTFIGYIESVVDGAYGHATMTVAANGKISGKITLDGTSVSATSPLVYDEEAGWFAILHAAPSAYKGGAFVAGVGFDATDVAHAASTEKRRRHVSRAVQLWYNMRRFARSIE